MADETIRAYYVLDAAAPRTPTQWSTLKTAVRNKPMTLALRNAGAVQNQPYLDVIMSRFSLLLQFLIVRFCVDPVDQTSLVAVLNAQCTIRSITGSTRVKFRSLLEAELREAIVDLGYGVPTSLLMTITEIGYGDRTTAIAAANAYVLANAGVWAS